MLNETHINCDYYQNYQNVSSRGKYCYVVITTNVKANNLYPQENSGKRNKFLCKTEILRTQYESKVLGKFAP